ncbi:DUF1127 domain-containing protein [Marivivens donghaensis]|uniref:DUF1127 domain-containing protein n=1 Tax=Marivivens donghaensis TaxID=1699413 RepID=A0ABX0VZX1_9RHOB|nr:MULTISPECIES: DUF1127 domain-containing protein [Marivivens]NIY72192.1 DUF1127 domain-containing protein [Marivivens donghaensis]
MVTIDNTRAVSPRLTYLVTGFFYDLLDRIEFAYNAKTTAKQLRKLTDRELDDIGLVRADIAKLEARARF